MHNKCPQCSFNSDFDFSVDVHLKFNHPTYPRKEFFQCTESSIEKRLCPEWDYETHFRIDFAAHLGKGHNYDKKIVFNEVDKISETIQEEKCQNCAFQTFSKFLRFVHEYPRENAETAVDSQVQSTEFNGNRSEKHTKICFQCYECEYKTYESHWLNEHKLLKHTPDDQIEWFKCSQCSYQAKCLSYLVIHVKTQHSSKGIQCDECSYKADTNHDLKRHKLKHDKFKWFNCAQCSYKAKSNQNLSVHVLRKHTPDNLKTNLECDQCHYKTYVVNNLKHHKLINHTADDQIKWFNCTQCSFKAKSSKNVTRHVRRRHRTNTADRHECDQCSFKTYEKYYLDRHKYRQHTPDDKIKRFYCAHCTYKSKYKSCLVVHVRRHVSR